MNIKRSSRWTALVLAAVMAVSNLSTPVAYAAEAFQSDPAPIIAEQDSTADTSAENALPEIESPAEPQLPETEVPDAVPTEQPAETEAPEAAPTEQPAETEAPEAAPTEQPTETEVPDAVPTEQPAETEVPDAVPSEQPTETEVPDAVPTEQPAETEVPDAVPSEQPADEESTELLDSNNKVLWSDSFETLAADSEIPETCKKYWKDGKVPAGWTSCWEAKAPAAGKNVYFELVPDPNADGKQVVHVASDDLYARIDMVNMVHAPLDYSKDYTLRFRARTKDINGWSFNIRFQAGGPKDQDVKHDIKVKGTNDWKTYELPITGLSAASTKPEQFKVELFCDHITGEAWIDQIEMVEGLPAPTPTETPAPTPAPPMVLEPQNVVKHPGDTFAVTIQNAPAGTPIVWKSSDEKMAAVDKDGNVTIHDQGGLVVITATAGDQSGSCFIAVLTEQAEKDQELMRNRWVDRITGNPYWNGDATPQDQKDTIAARNESAQKLRSILVEDSPEVLYEGLDLKLKEGSNSTNSKDSEDLSAAMENTYQLALTWATKGTELYHNEELLQDILYAMNWSYEHFYNESLDVKGRYGNWFHWWISMPKSLASTLALLGDKVPAELLLKEAQVLKHFNEDPSFVYKVKGANSGVMPMEGGNLSDTSLISLLRGITCSDPIAVMNGTKYFDKLVAFVTSGEGLYQDGSCIQHSDKAYTGGYGATLLRNVESLVFLVHGTSWDLQPEQLSNIYTWIWNGIRPLFVEGAVFDMVSGRGVSRASSTDYKTGRGLLAPICLMTQSAPDNIKPALQSFAKDQLQLGIKNYGNSYVDDMNANARHAAYDLLADDSVTPVPNKGYTHAFNCMDRFVAHNDKFSLGLSYASKRTSIMEFGNEENKKGWHQSDGVTFLYGGDPMQFSDAFWPTVDSHRLPGITTDHSEFKLSSWASYKGNGDFNGGVAVGPYGGVAMDFKNYPSASNPNLTAHKAWFVFDNEVVALGANINGIKKDRTTETIVDNKMIKGSNNLLVNGQPVAPNLGDTASFEDAKWAWMDGNTDRDSIGYYFPTGSKLNVLREARTGKWSDINGSSAHQNLPEMTRNYLSLAIPHGENVNLGHAYNNKYACYRDEYYDYVLLPGMSADEVKTYSENPDIKILANNAYVQAVRDNKAGVSTFLFWGKTDKWNPNPGNDAHKPLRVDNVSAYEGAFTVVDNKDGTVTVGMSDIRQTNDQISLRLYGTGMELVSADPNVTVKTDILGAVLTANTKDALGATFTATLKAGSVSEAELNEMAQMRHRYSDTLTGNTMADKTDEDYLRVMDNYAKGADKAVEQYIPRPEGKDTRTQLFRDTNINLDWENKGGLNTDGSDTYTQTMRYLRDLALAYNSEGCTKYYHNAETKAIILDGLEFMLDKFHDLHYPDRIFANWWDWSIGCPKVMTALGILMYDELPADMLEELHDILMLFTPGANDQWGRNNQIGNGFLKTTGGANGAEIAMVYALNGLLGNDPISLYQAGDSQKESLKYVTEGHGFFEDGSFREHADVAYTGSYGVEMLRGVTQIVSLLNGTTWAPVGVDPNIIYEWILNAYRPLYADGGVFDMVQGRSISRYGRTDMSTGRYAMDAILTLSMNVPEQYRDQILSFAKTQVLLGSQFVPDYFGRLRFSSLIQAKNLLNDPSIPLDQELYTKIYGSMDKAAIHADKYTMGVSMFSSRTTDVEYGNNENKKGWYTSDGALYLYAGDQAQYGDGYWASVDPLRLAGITTNHVTGRMPNFAEHKGRFDWAGGSISGTNAYASIGMDFISAFSDTKAKKSWFALGDQLVALGSGVASEKGDFVETIAENRRLTGNNELVVDGKTAIPAKGDKMTAANAQWAWLEGNVGTDSTGYYFPGKSNLELLREERTGKWSDINSSNYPKDETNNVTNTFLSIAFNHGVNPTDGSYSYVLLPGATKEETAAYVKDNSLKILSQTNDLHAILDDQLGVAGFNFWNAASAQVGALGIDQITANAPSSVTVALENGILNVGISNPTQKNDTVSITIAGKDLGVVSTDKNVTAKADENGITLTVNTKDALPGATSFVKVVSKTAANELLQKAEDFLNKDLTTEDLAKAEELLAALNGLTKDDVSDPEKLETLTAELTKVVEDMKAANQVIDALEKITEVTDANAEEVKNALNAFNTLTSEQNALLTSTQKAQAQRVEALLDAYLNSDSGDKPDPDDKPNPDGKPDPDDKPNPDNKPDADSTPNSKPVDSALAQTGDNSHMGMWVFLLVLAASGAAVSFYLVKKRNH